MGDFVKSLYEKISVTVDSALLQPNRALAEEDNRSLCNQNSPMRKTQNKKITGRRNALRLSVLCRDIYKPIIS